jgi:hypothetical protein
VSFETGFQGENVEVGGVLYAQFISGGATLLVAPDIDVALT